MFHNLTIARGFAFIFAVVLIAIAEIAIAVDASNFRRLPLKEGISIEVPAHWLVHSDAERKNFAAASEGSSRAAGIDYGTNGSKSRLLAVSALPTPSGAKIRVNIIRPPTLSGADLRSASAQDLGEFKAAFSARLEKGLAAQGVTLLTVMTPRIESINGSAVILTEYRRSDLLGKSPWTVRLYQIPAGDKLIELTMSFRESDATVWRPILDYAKQSLRF